MANFAALKKSSDTLSRLTKELEKTTSSESKAGDDRFWVPEVDKSGNGSAIIRFLPASAVDGDDALPWVRLFNHGFKGPSGKWYIENSLTSLGQKDPVSEYNSMLWNSTSDDNSPERKQARNQKRRLTYISNIMVISDPKNPQNEGKVFLYKYGKKIFDKITLLMNPEFEGDDAVNPFDFWKGANFKMRIRNVEGYRNYDMSQFETPSALDSDDEKLEAIWNKEYSLKEFIDPSQFKPYDELKKKLNDVLELVDEEGSASVTALNSSPKKVFEKKKTAEQESAPFSIDDDDEDLKQFKALALE